MGFIHDYRHKHRSFSAYVHPLLSKGWSSPSHRRVRGEKDLGSFFDPHPDIRLIPVRKHKMSSAPFALELHPPGINSTAIRVDRAIESDTVSCHLILESFARTQDIEIVSISGRVDKYEVTGYFEPNWRRREDSQQNWSSKRERWYLTPGPLPGGAQALVRRSSPQPTKSTAGTAAPVHGPILTAKQQLEDAARNKAAAEKRKKAKEASAQAALAKYYASSAKPLKDEVQN